MLLAFYLLAGAAGKARLTGRRRGSAVQRLGEAQRQGPAPHARRTAEQVGMAHFPLLDMPLQQTDSPFMAE